MRRDHKGQVYEVVESRPYRRRDGSETALLIWQTACAECCEAFTFTTPADLARFEPNRRCAKHKRPGCRVGGPG
jgi:hypothetical protein